MFKVNFNSIFTHFIFILKVKKLPRILAEIFTTFINYDPYFIKSIELGGNRKITSFVGLHLVYRHYLENVNFEFNIRLTTNFIDFRKINEQIRLHALIEKSYVSLNELCDETKNVVIYGNLINNCCDYINEFIRENEIKLRKYDHVVYRHRRI